MDEVWHVMTVSHGGTVSLTKNVTEEVARKMAQRLERGGNPWPQSVKWAAARLLEPERNSWSSWGHGYMVSDGDIDRVEVFGPPGATFVTWPKPADYDEQVRKKVEEFRALKASEPKQYEREISS